MEENFNIHLGKKLRMRRLSLGLTQTKVANAINVTFQQIQKYEKGTNGVSSSRLLQLSNFLKIPVTYFYENYADSKTNPADPTATEDFVVVILYPSDFIRIFHLIALLIKASAPKIMDIKIKL